MVGLCPWLNYGLTDAQELAARITGDSTTTSIATETDSTVLPRVDVR